MTFQDIEDEIISRIRAELPYFKTVETYAGQLEQEIEALPVLFPAAYVIYAGSDYKWVDGPNYNETCTFNVLIAAKNLKGQKAVRKDDNGAYQLAAVTLQALTNQDFGLAIERLTPVKVSLVYISKTAAIYGIDFQTDFDTEFNW